VFEEKERGCPPPVSTNRMGGRNKAVGVLGHYDVDCDAATDADTT